MSRKVYRTRNFEHLTWGIVYFISEISTAHNCLTDIRTIAIWLQMSTSQSYTYFFFPLVANSKSFLHVNLQSGIRQIPVWLLTSSVKLLVLWTLMKLTSISFILFSTNQSVNSTIARVTFLGALMKKKNQR